MRASPANQPIANRARARGHCRAAPSPRRGLGALALGLLLPMLCQIDAVAASAPSGSLVKLIRNEAGGTFDFDTPVMSGSIKAEGAYHGVSRLVDKRTGRQVIDPRYSALNLFRLFSVNLGMGTPRHMKRTIRATETAVEINWPATDEHQGEITARYEVREPDTIDLRLTLRSKGSYQGYELLLPNYFERELIPHVYLKRRAVIKNEPYIDLAVPSFSEVYRGCGLVFPRDVHSARRPLDGRWSRTEYKMPAAPFLPMRHYAHPFIFMTDPGKKMAVVLMMRRASCSAISARYYTEDLADRPTSYSAVDFLIFGDDVLPGDVRTADVRLVVTPLDATMSQPLKLHEKFIAEAEVATPQSR